MSIRPSFKMRDKTPTLDSSHLLSWWGEEQEGFVEEEHNKEVEEEEEEEAETKRELDDERGNDEEEEEGISRWSSANQLVGIGESCYGKQGPRALTIYCSQLVRRQTQLEALVATSKDRMMKLKEAAHHKRQEVKEQERVRMDLEERLHRLEEQMSRVPEPPPPHT